MTTEKWYTMAMLKSKEEHPLIPEVARPFEAPQIPETLYEGSVEQERIAGGERGSEHQSSNKQASLATQPSAAQARAVSPELLGIEHILSQGLDHFFLALSPDYQSVFKHEGEKTAQSIHEALQKPATTIKDIVNLIIAWLKKLPGINAFFLEQEAKIKADAILRRYRP